MCFLPTCFSPRAFPMCFLPTCFFLTCFFLTCFFPTCFFLTRFFLTCFPHVCFPHVFFPHVFFPHVLFPYVLFPHVFFMRKCTFTHLTNLFRGKGRWDDVPDPLPALPAQTGQRTGAGFAPWRSQRLQRTTTTTFSQWNHRLKVEGQWKSRSVIRARWNDRLLLLVYFHCGTENRNCIRPSPEAFALHVWRRFHASFITGRLRKFEKRLMRISLIISVSPTTRMGRIPIGKQPNTLPYWWYHLSKVTHGVCDQEEEHGVKRRTVKTLRFFPSSASKVHRRSSSNEDSEMFSVNQPINQSTKLTIWYALPRRLDFFLSICCFWEI